LLSYPARIIPEEDGTVRLTLPDVPEVSLIAVGEEEAFRLAPAALESALAGYVLEHRPFPSPSDIGGAPLVSTDRFSLLGVD
jgi:antitoxin HicB